jgi:hypothetical protein
MQGLLIRGAARRIKKGDQGMTLIGKPIGRVVVQEGKIVGIEWNENPEPERCDCGLYTRKTRQGFPECSVCQFFGYHVCSQCKHGIPRANFICNGNDLEDHFDHYTACAIRDCWGKVLENPNPESRASAWHVTIEERKKCFVPKADPAEHRASAAAVP